MSRTLAIILAALVLAAGTFYLYSSRSAESEQPQLPGTPQVDDSTPQQIEDIPFDEQWRNYLIGLWEWRDDGKDLLFVFGVDQRFIYYEKEYADNPNASEDNAFGQWEIVEADNLFATVKLISINEEQTEIVFRLEFIDAEQMAARTDDMPDDVYVLFTRTE